MEDWDVMFICIRLPVLRMFSDATDCVGGFNIGSSDTVILHPDFEVFRFPAFNAVSNSQEILPVDDGTTATQVVP